jgi:ABC-type nitrate/sulfonate/bicarbonate transport system ATPase subunit
MIATDDGFWASGEKRSSEQSDKGLMEIACEQIRKSYQSRQGSTLALHNVSFQVAAQEFVCIVGPSGCGKTTLLKLIAGLQTPDSGSITFGGQAGSLPSSQPTCAMVFQDQGLFPWLTVLENAAFGLEMQGVDRQTRQTGATAWLRNVGLADFLHSYPHQLSGGMRQRVALARAFLAGTPILLMDEPFAALDAQTRLLMQAELLSLWQNERKTVIYVTHDIEEAIWLGDRVLILSGRPGQILEDLAIPLARPRTLLHQMSTAEQTIMTEYRWHIWNRLKAEIE